MISEVLNSYGLTLDYLRRLVADVTDQDRVHQPNGALNHPAWVIGHLTYSCQAIGGELGLAAWLPDGWEQQFGTGSVPNDNHSAYPTKAELLSALADAQSRIAERLIVLGESGLAASLPDERYRSTFPTIGDAVLHILAGHAAVHVGQLSVWRRAAGYVPLSKAAL